MTFWKGELISLVSLKLLKFWQGTNNNNATKKKNLYLDIHLKYNLYITYQIIVCLNQNSSLLLQHLLRGVRLLRNPATYCCIYTISMHL